VDRHDNMQAWAVRHAQYKDPCWAATVVLMCKAQTLESMLCAARIHKQHNSLEPYSAYPCLWIRSGSKPPYACSALFVA
jgi:hypothetical protein